MPKKDFHQTLKELKLINEKGVLNYPIIETHCHLDGLKAQPTKDLIEQTTKLGIEKIITICVGPENFKEVLSLADEFESVYTTQGIHPHEAHSARQEHFEQIQENLSHPKVMAVGEIGLDYHYDFSPRDKQIDCFEKQLQLACDFDLPVVIHTRKAEEDTKSIIQNFASQLKRKGVFHSYTSSMELAKIAIGL
ncbi:MAG: TatD family hydrolase, partial [Bdellovibrionales bacterium]|nr:TatD family hydrolase [Bdellovibrionales bacterium]